MEFSIVNYDSAYWASLIIEELILHKITYFCIAPGSRSTALTLAAARHPQAKTMVHFDERGVGFHALGYSIGNKSPACIIVTSGTAVGNLLPSIMEAYYSHTPLIILTADRPPELRDCGSNQTVHQPKIFSDFVRWQFDLPCPEPGLSENFLRETISYAASVANGPVHINCMFREPLYSPNEHHSLHSTPKTTTFSFSPKMDTPFPFNPKKKGLILIGRMREDVSSILRLAEYLKWPVFGDILSGVRLENSPTIISTYDLLIKSLPCEQPEMVFHFGDRFVSKKLLEWIKPAHYSFISEHTDRFDPGHLFTHKFTTDSISFCESILNYFPEEKDSTWLRCWQEQEKIFQEMKLQALSTAPFIEGKAIYELSLKIPESWAAFFGNSMPIRDAEQFFFPKKIAGIFCNRGTSGIDGNIATSFGLASGLQRPILSVIGDLAFLHDINSLAQSKQKHPVIFVVLNNSGGGIFSYLKVADEKKHFDEFIRTKHEHTFSSIATQFSIPYAKIDSLEELQSNPLEEKTQILELIVNAEENKLFHQNLCQSFISTVS